MQNGKLSGSCPAETSEEPAPPVGSTEEAKPCALKIATRLLPHPSCVELPPVWFAVNVCDAMRQDTGASASGPALTECRVAQRGCAYQVSCNDGHVLAGHIEDDELDFRWGRWRCQGVLEDGRVLGACNASEGADPAGSCEFSIEAPPDPTRRECMETLPEEGIVLSGCVREGNICHLVQRSCIWGVACGDERYTGRVEREGQFEFTSLLGASCVASIADDEFVGHCEWGIEECDFHSREAEIDDGCSAAPPRFELEYCGIQAECVATQHLCKWQASCNRGSRILAGEANALGLSFEDDEGRRCSVEPTADGEFVGTCDGSDEDPCADGVTLSPP